LSQLVAPEFAWYFPAAHVWQVEAEVAPTAVEKEPGKHTVQALWPVVAA
jgi:hypothetical protein